MMLEKDSLVLGIDLGGTKILSCAVNAAGEALSSDRCLTPAEEGSDGVIRAILASAERVLGGPCSDSKVAAVGVATAGLVDSEAGVLCTSPNLPGWEDVPLRDILQAKLQKKIFLLNDGTAAAVGEYYFGAAKGVGHFIYVTISTGIGGAIVIDGKVLRGFQGMAGEIGHMIISEGGPPCRCGSRGCWEALGSGTALARAARTRIEAGTETTILKFAEGKIDQVTAHTVQRAAEAGDAVAHELILETAYFLGVGLTNLINLFNPQMIVIGGGLSNMGDRLLKPAYEVAERLAFRRSYRAVRFVRAALGGHSGALGAAAFAFHKLKAGP